MTDRIYYTEPSCRSFEATITRLIEHDGRPAVMLNRTAFYPTSGGQPFDTGTLAASGVGANAAAKVVDVIDEDGEVVVLDGVHGVILPDREGACRAG